MSDKGDAMYYTRGDRISGERYADTVQKTMVLFRPNTTIASYHQHLIQLQVSVFSRQTSGQYFPVEGTFGAHYTLWDPILFTDVRKNDYKST